MAVAQIYVDMILMSLWIGGVDVGIEIGMERGGRGMSYERGRWKWWLGGCFGAGRREKRLESKVRLGILQYD